MSSAAQSLQDVLNITKEMVSLVESEAPWQQIERLETDRNQILKRLSMTGAFEDDPPTTHELITQIQRLNKILQDEVSRSREEYSKQIKKIQHSTKAVNAYKTAEQSNR